MFLDLNVSSEDSDFFSSFQSVGVTANSYLI